MARVATGVTSAVLVPAVKNGCHDLIARPRLSRVTNPDVVMPSTPPTTAVLCSRIASPVPSTKATVVEAAGTGPDASRIGLTAGASYRFDRAWSADAFLESMWILRRDTADSESRQASDGGRAFLAGLGVRWTPGLSLRCDRGPRDREHVARAEPLGERPDERVLRIVGEVLGRVAPAVPRAGAALAHAHELAGAAGRTARR